MCSKCEFLGLGIELQLMDQGFALFFLKTPAFKTRSCKRETRMEEGRWLWWCAKGRRVLPSHVSPASHTNAQNNTTMKLSNKIRKTADNYI